MINEITIRIDGETMSRITGLALEALESEEGNIDFALLSELQSLYPDANVKASSFYVGDIEIEAYDAAGNPVSVSVAEVMPVVERALKSIG